MHAPDRIRGLLVLVGGLGALVLIAVAAGVVDTSVEIRDSSAVLPGLLLVGLGLVTVVGLVMLALGSDDPVRRLAGVAAAAAAVFVLIWGLEWLADRVEDPTPSPTVTAEPGPAEPPDDSKPATSAPVSGAWLLAASATLATLAAAVWLGRSWVSGRTDRTAVSSVSPDPAAAADVAESLDAAQARIRLGDDARSVIQAVYLTLGEILARHGLPRESSDTALEYLQRSLQLLQASEDSVRRLTHLFQEARYSDHVLSTEQADEAFGALQAISEELRSRTWAGSV